MSEDRIQEIFDRYRGGGRDSLIPLLQEVQEVDGCLTRESVMRIGELLNLPAGKIYGVATFYNQFRFQRQGRFHIQVCRGTACHVKGSAAVLEALESELGVGPGETDKNGVFSLEVVACIGACGLAPVISVNGNFHAGVTPDEIPEILESYREKDGGEE